MRFALLLVALLACGDDHPNVNKDSATVQDGAGSDATVTPVNFTSFVIDLVTNHTTNDPPAAFTDFSTLDDPDGSNGSAYSSLF